MRRRERAVNLACTLLLAVGALRLFALVLHQPMLGYANQYDMARTSACVSLWPSLLPPARYQANQTAPISDYVIDRSAPGPCLPTTIVAFVSVAKWVIDGARAIGIAKGEDFPMQAVGVTEALALTALVLWFCYAERSRPWARLAHAAIYAVVLADPANALWMNSFYTEFAAMFFAYAVGGFLALAAVVPPHRTRVVPPRGALAVPPRGGLVVPRHSALVVPPRGALVAACCVAIAGLALSREQYSPFAAIPLGILASFWWRRGRRGWFVVAAVVLVAWAAELSFVSRLPGVEAANRHDFYLGAALPAASNETAALNRLGLPQACRNAIGSNWFVGMGANPQTQCPEVEALGRLAFLRLAWDDPSLVIRILMRGIALTQTWWQHFLGSIAGIRFGDWSRVRSPLAISIADVSERIPFTAWLTVIGAVAAGWLAALVVWLREVGRRHPGDGFVPVVLYVCSLALYAPVSAIFGDGYLDASRHALLFHPAFAVLIVVAGGRVVRSLLNASGGASRPVFNGWLVLTILFSTTLGFAARHSPTSLGVVDLPSTRQLVGDRYTIHGWAIDPWGVAAVHVAAYPDWDASVPAAQWAAAMGAAVEGPLSEPLAIYFPTFPGVEHGGFSVELRRSAWPAAAPCLRTLVENRLGVTTEIDRRCVTR